MKKKILKLRDGKEVKIFIWDNVSKPRGLVQLIHGSLEHSKIYDELAKVFNDFGFIVVSDDHRGHGETDQDMLGHVGVDITASDIVNDLKEINSFYYKKYKLPVIIYGHSWGSYLARILISKKNVQVEKVIISGTGWESQFSTSFWLWLLRFLRLFKKDHQKSNLFNLITFKKFNKSFTTGMDLLINDQKEKIKFLNDKRRVDSFSISGYRSLFGAAKVACNKETLKHTSSVDILMIASTNDSVGRSSRGVIKFAKKIQIHTGSDVTLKIYKGQRHGIQKEIPFKDIKDFLS